jgi:short-subunit dehydrogenase
MSGVSPMPYFALYSATKAMLTNFYTSMHYELKKQGVKVTVVMPGGIPTRPDIIEQIKGQGLWGKLSSKTPEFVAEKSLKAVSKNKLKYIPGFFNKLLNFIMKIIPQRIVLAFIARRWKNQYKDAF